mmetsp:Transcript_16219/g.27441  ORF Transcript_16219/g.27441 Transcript_16219/m.27441 type:complete len:80 (-) Transcript_16219:793-1032(-)
MASINDELGSSLLQEHVQEQIHSHSEDRSKSEKILSQLKDQLKTHKVIFLQPDMYSLAFYGYYIEEDEQAGLSCLFSDE